MNDNLNEKSIQNALNPPETSPFFSAQMALVSTFFQMFIVLGTYNFVYGIPPGVCNE